MTDVTVDDVLHTTFSPIPYIRTCCRVFRRPPALPAHSRRVRANDLGEDLPLPVIDGDVGECPPKIRAGLSKTVGALATTAGANAVFHFPFSRLPLLLTSLSPIPKFFGEDCFSGQRAEIGPAECGVT